MPGPIVAARRSAPLLAGQLVQLLSIMLSWLGTIPSQESRCRTNTRAPPRPGLSTLTHEAEFAICD